MSRYFSHYSFNSLMADFEEYVEEFFPYLSSSRSGHLFKIICKEFDSGLIKEKTDTIGCIKSNLPN